LASSGCFLDWARATFLSAAAVALLLEFLKLLLGTYQRIPCDKSSCASRYAGDCY
jgi:hypothetical protein